jgi:hypothetical protein
VSSLLEQTRAMVRRPLPTAPRPRLTIVPRLAGRAPRVPFVALVVVVLTTGLIGLLLLNTGLQRGAYRVSALQARADGLTLREQQLQRHVSDLSQPERIAREAIRLGMVQNLSPAFLDLRTGRTLGHVHTATAADRFKLAPVQGAAARRQRATRSIQRDATTYDRAVAYHHRLTLQVTAAKRAAERRAAQRAARQKAARQRAAQHRAAQHRAAQHRVAQHRAAQHRAADRQAAQQQAKPRNTPRPNAGRQNVGHHPHTHHTAGTGR